MYEYARCKDANTPQDVTQSKDTRSNGVDMSVTLARIPVISILFLFAHFWVSLRLCDGCSPRS